MCLFRHMCLGRTGAFAEQLVQRMWQGFWAVIWVDVAAQTAMQSAVPEPVPQLQRSRDGRVYVCSTICKARVMTCPKAASL